MAAIEQDIALELLIAEFAEHYRKAPIERKPIVDEETKQLCDARFPEDSKSWLYYMNLYHKEKKLSYQEHTA